MQFVDTDLHLPWDNTALEQLLRRIIQTGETTKVDFKSQLSIASAAEQGELLKDISAIANTYDYVYQNHGFLIFGVSWNAISFTTFSQNPDAMQASIDSLVKTYIGPFIPTHFRTFGTGAEVWGALVIPPTRTAPHVFVKDIHKRAPGDIHVRRGTTTDKASPGDYARFFRLHLDEQTYELRQRLDEMSREISAVRKQSNLWVESLKTPSPPPEQGQARAAGLESIASQVPTQSSSDDLLATIDAVLGAQQDRLTAGLFKEAERVHKFVTSDRIPWSLTTAEKDFCDKLLCEIEGECKVFWQALSVIAYKDEKGNYEDALVRALSWLTRMPEAPPGVAFSDWAINIRHFPLLMSVYILFILGASKKRYSLLKRISGLRLSSRSRYQEMTPIPYILFHTRRADPIFQTQNPEYPDRIWCDAVGSYVDQVYQRIVTIADPLFDKRAEFFVGEFLLALTSQDQLDREAKAPAIGHPATGLYLYFNEAVPILQRFLRDEGKAASQVFKRPFKEILEEFDATAAKLVSGRCFAHGFVTGAAQIVYPAESAGGF